MRKYLLLDIHGSLGIHFTWEKKVQEVYSTLVKAPLSDFYLLWRPTQTVWQAKKLKFPSDGAWRCLLPGRIFITSVFATLSSNTASRRWIEDPLEGR